MLFTLIAVIIYLVRDHKKEVAFLNRMIKERDDEITQLKLERNRLFEENISNNLEIIRLTENKEES